jgi:hypothetical protein
VSVDPGAEFDGVEVLRLGVRSRVVLGAEVTHPCFASALEVRFDFGLCFVGQVHVVRISNQLGFASRSCVIVDFLFSRLALPLTRLGSNSIPCLGLYQRNRE